jgi:hypothetical protein
MSSVGPNGPDGPEVQLPLYPESGLNSDIGPSPFRAMCGRLRIGKDFLHAARLVGAAMCSAFECGSHDRWP